MSDSTPQYVGITDKGLAAIVTGNAHAAACSNAALGIDDDVDGRACVICLTCGWSQVIRGPRAH